MLKHSLLILFILTFVVCEKQEGEGGKGEISGTVTERLLAADGSTSETRPAADVNVFIIYGDNDGYQDNIKTSFSEDFKFHNLRNGSYTMYAVGDCDICASGVSNPDTTEVEKNSVTAYISIATNVDYDDGSVDLIGTLIAQQYIGPAPFGDPYVLQNREVYIRYNNEEVYFDKMDTDANG
ncbi:MAG: hypothetical protein HRT71_16490 [Flavobacteriales bacterium]|nr:hypothetical protein [Flavobacteriales bacterium]